MSEAAPKDQALLYGQDFHAWSQEQGSLLKARKAAALDWENLAEEIESLGRFERSEIRNRLTIVLLHLLKWEFQPEKRKLGWSASILEARDQINQQLEDSPSMRSFPSTVVERQYEIARLRAAGETQLPLEAFPLRCPYALADILDEGFLPGAR